jgi:hypothetical protein
MTGRHTIDFTLILTAVAFKLTISQMIPAVSYLTLLDKYILTCSGALFALTVRLLGAYTRSLFSSS